LIIKQSGYNVFPEEVEAYINHLKGVQRVAIVGVDHRLLGDGIYAFVQPGQDSFITMHNVMQHCKKIASYKRPQYVNIWPFDCPFPLTNNTKIDRKKLTELARKHVEQLRADGLWDSQFSKLDF
jgi:acyl-CoA synthetase (AMP-forming)/AMP-acid ligase II